MLYVETVGIFIHKHKERQAGYEKFVLIFVLIFL